MDYISVNNFGDMNDAFKNIVENYKSDKESVYNTWFVNNEERLKAFRSIRRGVQQVVKDIKEKNSDATLRTLLLNSCLPVLQNKNRFLKALLTHSIGNLN